MTSTETGSLFVASSSGHSSRLGEDNFQNKVRDRHETRFAGRHIEQIAGKLVALFSRIPGSMSLHNLRTVNRPAFGKTTGQNAFQFVSLDDHVSTRNGRCGTYVVAGLDRESCKGCRIMGLESCI